MNRRRWCDPLRVFAAVLAFSLVPGGRLAAADDPSATAGAPAVAAMLKGAQAATQSFRMQVSGPGLSGLATIVNTPKRMHMQMVSGPVQVELYISDGYAYQKIAQSGWKKQQLPSGAALVDVQRMFDGSATIVSAPDIVDGAVTYGAITVQLAAVDIPGVAPAPPLSVTCSYDKKTYLMHACTAGQVTETFSGYNDPANVVTLPAELAGATDVGPVMGPSPAPAATH